jgi:hypothetical protein
MLNQKTYSRNQPSRTLITILGILLGLFLLFSFGIVDFPKFVSDNLSFLEKIQIAEYSFDLKEKYSSFTTLFIKSLIP